MSTSVITADIDAKGMAPAWMPGGRRTGRRLRFEERPGRGLDNVAERRGEHRGELILR
jgi:hypothetical protein